MTVAAPPEPPHAPRDMPAPSIDPFEALIEEAHERTRRRRRRNGTALALIALGLLGALVGLTRGGGQSALASAAEEASTGARLPAGEIAVSLSGTGGTHVVIWSRAGVRDTPVEGAAYAWSPDGTRLLVGRPDGLHVVTLDGARDVLLSPFARPWEASWSPDGTKVVFEGNARSSAPPGSWFVSMYVVNADGTGLHRIAGVGLDHSPYRGNPSWSQDGTRILFAGAGAPGKSGMYVSRADGRGSARRIPIQLKGLVLPSWPRFSADGLHIAFEAKTGAWGGGLYVMNADGTHVRLVSRKGHAFVWSPDGKKLAFRGDGVEVVNADGTGLTSLAHAAWSGMSWSPDGRYLAVVGSGVDASSEDVFLVRTDGKGAVRILRAPRAGYSLPLWRGGTASTSWG